jgi:hypothetical protein
MRLACPQQRRTRARRCGVLLLIAVGSCASRPVHAAGTESLRVLLIEQGSDPLVERVGAEIEGLGFSLVRRAVKGPLETAARAERAVAALRVLPSRKGIEVWMADATSGRSLLRQVIVDESPQGPDRELIALQTAELLRTSLLGEKPARAHREPVAATTQPVVAAPKQIRSTASANPTRDTGVQLACGALYSPGGVSAGVELGLSLHRFLTERWGVALDLGMPLHSGTLTDVEGSTKLGAYFAGAALLARFERQATPFFATAGAGAAVLLVKYAGETREPLRSTSGSRLTGAAYLRGDVGIETAAWLRFGLRVLVGASFQRLALTFAGNDAGAFGPAFFAGFALAEVSLP